MDLMEIRSSKLAQPVTCVGFTWKVPGHTLSKFVAVFLHHCTMLLKKALYS